MLKESSAMIQKLGFANEIDIQENKENIPQNAMSVLADGIEVYIPFEELVDLEAENKDYKVKEQNYFLKLQEEKNAFKSWFCKQSTRIKNK